MPVTRLIFSPSSLTTQWSKHFAIAASGDAVEHHPLLLHPFRLAVDCRHLGDLLACILGDRVIQTFRDHGGGMATTNCNTYPAPGPGGIMQGYLDTQEQQARIDLLNAQRQQLQGQAETHEQCVRRMRGNYSECAGLK